MATFYFILLLLGAICFAATVVRAKVAVDLIALGLLFWICVPLIHTIRVL